MSEFKVGDRVRLICCRKYGTIIKEKEMFGTRHHYTVLFDYDETDCLVPEEDLEIVDEHGKTLLEQRIEKLEKCANMSTMSKNGLLTEDERVILRNLDKEMYKWIAREENNKLRVYWGKPTKKNGLYWDFTCGYENFYMYNHLFQFIKWEDDEPYNIEELLKGECGNE